MDDVISAHPLKVSAHCFLSSARKSWHTQILTQGCAAQALCGVWGELGSQRWGRVRAREQHPRERHAL